MITDDNTMIAATDRSIPAVSTTKLCAAAKIPITETCCRISDRLKGWKKRSPAITPNARILSSSTMTGTIVGLPCKKCCKRTSGEGAGSKNFAKFSFNLVSGGVCSGG